MNKRGRWHQSSLGHELGDDPTIARLAQRAAELDVSDDAVLDNGPEEVIAEWRDYLDGDDLADLSDEEWAEFARVYAHYLGADL